jgi:hypothetical protein
MLDYAKIGQSKRRGLHEYYNELITLLKNAGSSFVVGTLPVIVLPCLLRLLDSVQH